MIAPLMSCSARLPVYTIMIAAFIPRETALGGLVGLQGLTLFCMYALGVVVAIPVAWVLKKTLLKGETPPFLMELPSYKWPQPATVARRVFSHGMEFLRRAGTLIFAITVIVWALAYFPHSDAIRAEYAAQRTAVEAGSTAASDREAALAALSTEENGAYLRDSYIGRMGRAIEPVVEPLGWDWRIGMAAIASFPAREVVVATLGTIFNLGGAEETSESFLDTLRAAKREDGSALFTIPVALSIMVFFALCCQCGATLAMLHRETRSWRWPAFTFAYMTVLAYTVAFLVYQATTWMGWGAF